jgi:hypothetical protein
MLVVLMCASTSCIAGGFSNLAPDRVESYGVNFDARSSGVGQTANGLGMIIGSSSLALIDGTSRLVSPHRAVFPALVGLSFLFLGVETRGRAMAPDHGTYVEPERACR